jgi:hypothetical protein
MMRGIVDVSKDEADVQGQRQQDEETEDDLLGIHDGAP